MYDEVPFNTASRIHIPRPHKPPTQDVTILTNSVQRAFYKSFGRPIAKVFFMALFTYQVLHYSWMRLESMEEQEEKTAELQGLEGQLRELAKSTKKT
jgi:hypothetical protein